MAATLPATGTNGASFAEGSPLGAALALGNAADAATAVGVILDNAVRLVTAGALALSIRNGGTSILNVTKDGKLKPQTVATTKTAVAATCGTCALDTNGTVTVTTTAVSTASIIFVMRLTDGGTVGGLYTAKAADIVDATSFIIRSFVSSTAGAATAATTDTSTVGWLIIG